MSAYIVEREHIEYLIDAADWVAQRNRSGCFSWYDAQRNRHELRGYENGSAIGQMLWDENYRSVNARYSESDTAPSYVHRSKLPRRFDPVQILKSIACFEYQSCETEDWEQSLSFAFCRALRHCAIHQLPGYGDAMWGVPKAEGR